MIKRDCRAEARNDTGKDSGQSQNDKKIIFDLVGNYTNVLLDLPSKNKRSFDQRSGLHKDGS